MHALDQKRTGGTMGPMPVPEREHSDCERYHYGLGYADGWNTVRDRLNPYLEARPRRAK